MSSNNVFPKEMLFDKKLTQEQLELLINQYQRILSIGNEKVDNKELFLNNTGEVILPEGTLIHGTTVSDKVLEGISRNGILACEFLGKAEDGETFYCADFHRVKNKTLLSDYDKNFTRDGKTPFNVSNNKIAFVINPCSKIGGLLYYDLFDSKFNNNSSVRNIINAKGVPRGFLDTNRGEGSAILGGLPSNCISGIILGDKVVLDTELIKKIENYFPNAYLVTRSGNIIKDRSNVIKIEDYERIALALSQKSVENEILTKKVAEQERENSSLKENYRKMMSAIIEKAPPLIQAQILITIGYQSLPYSLMEQLTDEEIKSLGFGTKRR